MYISDRNLKRREMIAAISDNNELDQSWFKKQASVAKNVREIISERRAGAREEGESQAGCLA